MGDLEIWSLVGVVGWVLGGSLGGTVGESRGGCENGGGSGGWEVGSLSEGFFEKNANLGSRNAEFFLGFRFVFICICEREPKNLVKLNFR